MHGLPNTCIRSLVELDVPGSMKEANTLTYGAVRGCNQDHNDPSKYTCPCVLYSLPDCTTTKSLQIGMLNPVFILYFCVFIFEN